MGKFAIFVARRVWRLTVSKALEKSKAIRWIDLWHLRLRVR